MPVELTSIEAAAAAGVSPSTFRSYVARGQAPPPRRRAGGVNLWSLVDLVAWRELDLPDETKRVAIAEVARTYSRAREWQNSTRRWLAQLGITQADAQSLLDGIVPGGMETDTFRDASYVLHIRRDLLHRLAADVAFEQIDEAVAIRGVADRIVAGDGVFEALADLVVELTASGYPEVLLPSSFDEDFWESQDDADDLADYLADLPRVALPEVV